MESHGTSLRPSRGGIRTALVVSISLLVGILPAGALADAPSGPLGHGAPVDSGGPPSSPLAFGERAGYSPARAAEVTHTSSATGTRAIDLTFEPTDQSFYDAPALGQKPMTVREIANDYGLSPSAYASVETYFVTLGLTVVHAWPDRLSLSLSGPTTAVDEAFGTALVSGTYEGREVTFPATPPSLPAWLEAQVRSVAGLSTGFDTFSLPTTPAPIPRSVESEGAANPADLVTPAIARDIYDISGLYNLTSVPTFSTGEGIVLLLWGWGYSPQDIQTFFSADYPSAFPATQVVPYPIDGAPAPSANAPSDPSNGSREMTLDLEWSGSMAPGATLDAVYAPPGPAIGGYSPSDSSMIDALNTAVDPSMVPGVVAISMSFGSADGGDSTLTSGFENAFAVAAHEGVSLFAASDDTGGDASPGCTGGALPDYPSASPQVVAVGGTAVALDRSVLGTVTGFSEAAWDQSGGGFSKQFNAPAWQEVGSAAAPIEANGHRGIPDVAATASYNFLYFNGQPEAGGGTSFATPLWAGMVTEMDALRGATLGFLTPGLYQLAATEANESPGTRAFNDITTGANCLGPAGPGWDTATGWGSPKAVLLYEHLVSTFVNLSIAASPSPVAPGGAVTVVATISNATDGVPLGGVSVVVVLSSSGLGGPCSGTFGSVSLVSNVSGEAVAVISVPVCFLGSSALATVTVASQGYYGVASTSVDVNLLGLDPGLAPLATFPDNVVLFAVLLGAGMAVGVLLGGRSRRREPPVRPPSRRDATAARPDPSPGAPGPRPSPQNYSGTVGTGDPFPPTPPL